MQCSPRVKALIAMGFEIIATRGTARFLRGRRRRGELVNKVLEGRPHIVDAMKNGEVQLVFNTTEGAQALADSTLHPAHSASDESSLLHDHGRRRRRDPGHCGAAVRLS